MFSDLNGAIFDIITEDMNSDTDDNDPEPDTLGPAARKRLQQKERRRRIGNLKKRLGTPKPPVKPALSSQTVVRPPPPPPAQREPVVGFVESGGAHIVEHQERLKVLLTHFQQVRAKKEFRWVTK